MSLVNRVREFLDRYGFVAKPVAVRFEPPDDLDAYHKQLWAELPEPLQHRMVHILKTRLTSKERQYLAKLVRVGGPEWMVQDATPPVMRDKLRQEYGFYVPTPFHMSGGMAVRNLLREHGVKDRELPTGNLDDYYAEAIEAMAAAEPWPRVVWIQTEARTTHTIDYVRHAEIVIRPDGRISKAREGLVAGRPATEAEKLQAEVIW